MVYSIDKESSFDSMYDILAQAQSFNQQSLFFLVGNKEDLDKAGNRQVAKKDG